MNADAIDMTYVTVCGAVNATFQRFWRMVFSFFNNLCGGHKDEDEGMYE